MKALVFEAPNEAKVAEVNPPKIGPDEILVKSQAVGICHSDFEFLEGHYIIPVDYPAIPGHEWAGEVVEVGDEVSSFTTGDRVVGECVIGDDHFGFSISGAAAEYFKARPTWLHRLPEELTYRQGAIVEPFTVAYYATVAAGGVDASDTAVILGAGPIGQCCVAAVAGRGGRAIVVDPVAERRKIAAELGAETGLDPDEGDLASQVEEITEGRGADVVLEASGAPAAMASALEVAGQGARVAMVGIDVGSEVPAKLGLIQSKELRVQGTIGSPGVWPAALRFLARTGIDLSPIVTSTYGLSEATDALESARNTRENIKVQMVNE
jgi:L-iditol 2-dehydrogenase